ncbi:30S ribosomal protein S14 [archaeon SCG-AAA382B04]|nr:30S ribosomal protein S14 [archaeon SCG-AAA382B04]
MSNDERRKCRRCGRDQALISKYDICLCRQCFREIAENMGFEKYR